MPVAPTFPGVYIEEIPSGVRTIVGVATNIAAFLGRAIAGPANQATVINSFADFDRTFGGLGIDYPMSYAVNDFYQNGGSQAIIVRLAGAASASATLTLNTLSLVASSPGAWGNALQGTVDSNGITADVASRYGLSPGDLFNLTVTEIANGRTLAQERFLNLSWRKDTDVPTVTAAGRAQRVDRVLAQLSQLVRVAVDSSGKPKLPGSSPVAASGSSTASSGAGSTGSGAGSTGSGTGSTGSGTGSTGSGTGSTGSGTGSTGSTGSSSGSASSSPPAPTQAQNGADDNSGLKDTDFIGDPVLKTGLSALDNVDLFNILCIPPDQPNVDIDSEVYSQALEYCVTRRAMLIVDTPIAWGSVNINAPQGAASQLDAFMLKLNPGDNGRNGALYFPRVQEADPLSKGQVNAYSPCGMAAGVMARTDVARGVWKAPAGVDATLNGAVGLEQSLTNAENGQLNPKGLNCLRSFPLIGSVVWGARTMRGADQLADDYKYVPVRRLALYLEESLYRGTQWVVFEPNDEPLWAQIRLNVGSFMHNLFVQGAFQGQTPTDAYFVKCDKDTTTQNDINLGVVNIIVGFAPLKPAEFVIIQIQQIAGSIAT